MCSSYLCLSIPSTSGCIIVFIAVCVALLGLIACFDICGALSGACVGFLSYFDRIVCMFSLVCFVVLCCDVHK